MPKHEASTVQINLSPNLSYAIRQLGQAIPEEALAGKGRDIGGIHVTLRWGILSDDPKPIYYALATYLPCFLRLGKLSVFPPSPSSDGAAVLYVEIHSQGYFDRMHEALAVIEHKPYQFPYNAHATVAYVKLETEALVGLLPSVEGMDMIVRSVVLSDREGKQIEIHGGQYETSHVGR